MLIMQDIIIVETVATINTYTSLITLEMIKK